MKKALLFTILAIFAFTGKAQITMLDTSYSWAYSSSCTYEFGSFTDTYYNSIGIDTIVNSKTYKIVNDSNNIYGEAYDLFREDSGFVFHYSNDYGEEIYYDFNLQVGDTFHFPQTSVAFNSYTIVDSVQTKFLFGQLRKIIKFTDDNFLPNFAFIEGVGSTFGLVYDHGWYFDCNLKLLCFTDSLGTYLAPNEDSCYQSYSTTGIATNSINNFLKIHPNPAQDKLYISSTTELIKSEFFIMNSLGKIEKSIKGEFYNLTL